MFFFQNYSFIETFVVSNPNIIDDYIHFAGLWKTMYVCMSIRKRVCMCTSAFISLTYNDFVHIFELIYDLSSFLAYHITGCHSKALTPPTDSLPTPIWPLTHTAVGGSRCPQKRLWHPPLSKLSLKMRVNCPWWEKPLNTCHSKIWASSFFLPLLENIMQRHTACSFASD